VWHGPPPGHVAQSRCGTKQQRLGSGGSYHCGPKAVRERRFPGLLNGRQRVRERAGPCLLTRPRGVVGCASQSGRGIPAVPAMWECERVACCPTVRQCDGRLAVLQQRGIVLSWRLSRGRSRGGRPRLRRPWPPARCAGRRAPRIRHSSISSISLCAKAFEAEHAGAVAGLCCAVGSVAAVTAVADEHGMPRK
jgi:hypothetical protein